MWPDGENRIPLTGDDRFREVYSGSTSIEVYSRSTFVEVTTPEVRPRGANRRLAGFRPRLEALLMRNP